MLCAFDRILDHFCRKIDSLFLQQVFEISLYDESQVAQRKVPLMISSITPIISGMVYSHAARSAPSTRQFARTMTTAISLLKSQGIFIEGVTLGIILLIMAFILQWMADYFQKEETSDENY